MIFEQTELIRDTRTTAERYEETKRRETHEKQRANICEELPLFDKTEQEARATVQLSLF